MGSDNLFHKRKSRKTQDLKRAKNDRAQRRRYLIVCEGTKTEPNYLRELLDDWRISSKVVRIAPNDGQSPDRVVEHAFKTYKEDAESGDPYDTVFCIFDRDAHSNFDAAVARTRDLQNSGTPIQAITSTPCFEIWFLLHFDYTDKPFQATSKRSAGDQLVSKLKTKPGFQKYQKGHTGIYQKLKNNIEIAIRNASQLRTHCAATDSSNPETNIDKVILELKRLIN